MDGFHKGSKTEQGNMDDLWEKFWAIYSIANSMGWEIDLRKIKSHTLEPNSDYLTGESIDLEDMPYEHRLGNSYADYWADIAAKIVACDQGHRQTVSMNDASGWLIRNGLLCICQNFLPQHKRELRMPARHRFDKIGSLEEKGHQVTKCNQRLVCNMCNSTWPDKGQSIIYSNANICSGIPPMSLDLQIGHSDGPRRYLAAGLHIRGVKVHESHRLAYHRGAFCSVQNAGATRLRLCEA